MRTGCLVRCARSAACPWTERSSLPPKPPPAATCVTRTDVSGSASNSATWRRSSQTPWPWEKRRSAGASGDVPGTARQDSGSRNACSTALVVNRSRTTWAAFARAVPASPRRTTAVSRRLPRAWIAGESGSSAANGSLMGVCTSYCTSMSAAAARAWRLVRAATAARTSPTYRVVSPSATKTGQSRAMSPTIRSPGTSAAVTTATTPGATAARDVSMRRTTARGWSENRRAPWSISGTTRSFTNDCSPRASSRAPRRTVREPTPLPASTSGIGSPRRAAATRSTASIILT